MVGRGWWCDFLCYVEHGLIREYRRGTHGNRNSFLFTSTHTGTHKDPVGTALQIQEANMDDTTQRHTQNALHDYREKSKSRGFQRHRLLYLTLKTT
ncbi:hypothetical protein TNCV_2219701 [Trichonephila clavipes]|nr:hypothetical protein TNCV_2219701 [Trichonephila clavipes]